MDKDTVILRSKKDSKRIRQCRVVFSYKQDHEDELNLNIGDIIDILGEEEEGWWKGILNGKVGVFPSNFVEEIVVDKLKASIEDLTATENGDSILPLSPAQPAKILCEVKYSYKAQNEDELSLKEGDIVTLLSKDGQDPGWWKGELNGLMGVFPDNFVVILPYNPDKSPNGKTPLLSQPYPLKPSSIASQRKSLENKSHNHNIEKTDISGHGDNKVSPPVPNKKPAIAVKKSPSGNVSPGGLFKEIKKKIVDVVDGATTSKSALSTKNENADGSTENVFDQVERVALLTDVRATRAKKPGRRPPSMVFREEESAIPNGNSEQQLEMVTEQTTTTSDTDGTEVKPKLREWEKHKAPWLAEMKLNQAKRTTPSPNQQPESGRSRLTPTEKLPETEENSGSSKPPEPATTKQPRKQQQDVDNMLMSKSLTSLSSTPLSSKSKSESEKVPLRPKPILTNLPTTPRPTSVQSVSPVALSPPSGDALPSSKPTTPSRTPSSPPAATAAKTPLDRIGVATTVNNDTQLNNNNDVHHQDMTVTDRQYAELTERIRKLEMLVDRQNVLHNAALEELKAKLQLETEMRHMLQEETSTQDERESSTSDDQEKFRCTPYSITYGVATFLGIIMVTLTVHWCAIYGGGFSLRAGNTAAMNWHFFFSVLAFVFLYGQTLLIERTEKYFRICGRFRYHDKKTVLFYAAFFAKILILTLIAIGLKMARDHKDQQERPIPNLYSLHSWLGVAAIVLFSLDLLLGLFLQIFHDGMHAVMELMMSVRWICGTMAYVTSLTASVSGLKEEVIFVYRDYSALPSGAVLLNVSGLIVVLFGCLVMNLLLKKLTVLRYVV